MRLTPQSAHMGGLALLLATSVQAQYVRPESGSGSGSGSGMRSRDRSALSLSGSLMRKRQEMRPGAGEAEQAAAGGDQAPAETVAAAATGGEGHTDGDEAAPEVSLPPTVAFIYGSDKNRVPEVMLAVEMAEIKAAVEGAIPST